MLPSLFVHTRGAIYTAVKNKYEFSVDHFLPYMRSLVHCYYLLRLTRKRKKRKQICVVSCCCEPCSLLHVHAVQQRMLTTIIL
jgi:hypothetical protein